ncbi:MAG: PHP domain-containing protein [Kiritimatiellae bacterium]|nr:PHP domain-containing protein [Kiritimatiellia bacterium]
MIDLHLHSIFSDGSLTPEELVAQGLKQGLTALALTDHDTTDGTARFLAACADRAVVAMAGVEISADHSPGSMHMLGYMVEPDTGDLEPLLARIRDGRDARNHAILAKLNELGIAVSMADARAFAGTDVVGRPHIARAMLERGVVSTVKDAFDRYLAKGKPAYVDRVRLSPADSIAAIRSARGVAVLAHPFTVTRDSAALKRLLRELVDAGLGGIEAYYSEHTADMTRTYLDLAKALDLVVTGGTDYHGATTPQLRIGTGFGQLRVPDELVAPLRARKP